jgi:hypothetical protein
MSIRSEGGDSISEHRGRIGGANGSMVRKVSAVSIGIIPLSLFLFCIVVSECMNCNISTYGKLAKNRNGLVRDIGVHG